MYQHSQTFYSGPLRAVVLDWAGTTVDYGCFGPVMAFQEIYRARFIELGVEEIRVHMGIDKMEHLKAIGAMSRVRKLWSAIYGRELNAIDLQEMHRHFNEVRRNHLHRHCELVPGLLDTVSWLRGHGLRIGTTSGYDHPGAELMRMEAAQRGFWPDCIVCASDVPAGRPNPWMCFRNAMELGTYPMSAMVKVGDTHFDVLEGLNAGMWTVAVTCSGNEMGLTLDDVLAMDPSELTRRRSAIEAHMRLIGAHFVIDDIRGLASVIEEINQLLSEGILPDAYAAMHQAASHKPDAPRAAEKIPCTP
jgi:phosphonoacetaldehyde hydrolase